MLDFIKKGLLRTAASSLRDFACPQCGLAFHPLQDPDPAVFGQPVVCPRCGWSASITKALEIMQALKVNPPGPFTKPPQSRIVRRVVSPAEILFDIPASGRKSGLFFFTIAWNVISWVIFAGFLWGMLSHGTPSAAPLALVLPIIGVFPLLGLIMAYFSFRQVFAVHLLYLSPDRIRLQRQFWAARKDFDLSTPDVTGVSKVEFYQENYQPVHGIEIRAARGKIRFGSTLLDDEKNWLCWEIREFIRPYARALA